MENNNQIVSEKSEILFLYEGKNNEPNGDPFTGEQRYDEETKKVLVSDVRIKRYIRDFIDEYDNAEIEQTDANKDATIKKGELIYVKLDRSNVSAQGYESGSAARMTTLKKLFPEIGGIVKKNETKQKKQKKSDIPAEIQDSENVKVEDNAADSPSEVSGKQKKGNTLEVLKKCIDVRLFGGISTEEGDAINLTGPVQFALLNPSLNQVILKPHQNTTTFPSKMKTPRGEDQRGSIGTKAVVPYSINQIHGWINPKSAEKTDATNADVKKMFYSLWNQVNIINTRSKANHSALILIQIVYAQPFQKIYGIDTLIDKKLKSEEMMDEQIRSLEDYQFDFAKLIEAADTEKIKEIRFYTEIGGIKNSFNEEGIKTALTVKNEKDIIETPDEKKVKRIASKFKEMKFSDVKLTSQIDEGNTNNN